MFKSIQLFVFFAMLFTIVACAASPEPKLTTIQGTVFYNQNQYLRGANTLVVRLSDTSLMDAPSPIIAEYNRPIAAKNLSKKPLYYHLNYDASALKVGRSYSLSARILTTKTGQLKWISTTNFRYIPGKTTNFAIRVDPVSQREKRQHKKLSYQCGQNIATVELLGKFVKLHYQGSVWMLTKVESASGNKYANQQVVYWSKGKQAMIQFTGQGAIQCILKESLN